MRCFSEVKYRGKKYGGYTIEDVAGEGRYGLCFHAINDNGEKVIIKRFKPGIFAQNAKNNAHEAVILSKLSDKRIPELLGVINEKSFYAFVLELKPGTTLKDMIFKYNYKFSDEEIFNIGIKIINIVKYLHENGVVHRDIRIPNILLDQGDVYLIDFGLARFADNSLYKYDLDYSYLGDLLLYLIYSSFQKKDKKKQPWYEELLLKDNQKLFLMRLMGLDAVYESINDIETDFIDAFA
jgi:serine/threonine-protein kinase